MVEACLHNENYRVSYVWFLLYIIPIQNVFSQLFGEWCRECFSFKFKNVSVRSSHHDNYILLCICKLSLFSSLLPKGYIILDLGPFKEWTEPDWSTRNNNNKETCFKTSEKLCCQSSTGLIFSSKQKRTLSLGNKRPLHAEHDRTLRRHISKMLFYT